MAAILDLLSPLKLAQWFMRFNNSNLIFHLSWLCVMKMSKKGVWLKKLFKPEQNHRLIVGAAGRVIFEKHKIMILNVLNQVIYETLIRLQGNVAQILFCFLFPKPQNSTNLWLQTGGPVVFWMTENLQVLIPTFLLDRISTNVTRSVLEFVSLRCSPSRSVILCWQDQIKCKKCTKQSCQII